MNDIVPKWARATFESRIATVDSTAVPYLVGGEGPPLLMVHGLSASLDWWQANAPALARHLRVYLVDLPGFGRQGHLKRADSTQDVADWLVRFMDAVRLEQAHLMGLSMGANIVIRLAASHYTRVDKLVLVTPSVLSAEKPLATHVITSLNVLREIPPSMVLLALRDSYRAALRAIWNSSQSIIERDILEVLPRVQAVSLLIASNNDPVLPVSLAEDIYNRLPDARLVIIPGARHLVMLGDSDRLNREVLKHLTCE